MARSAGARRPRAAAPAKTAYNARRQRVLDGKAPDQVVAERLEARRKLGNQKPHGRAGAADIARARLIADAAKDVPPPDS